MMQDPQRLLDDANVSGDVLEALRAAGPTAPMPEKVLARNGRRIAVMAAFPAFMAGVFKTKVAIAAALILTFSAVAVTSAVVVVEHGSASTTSGVTTVGVATSPAAPHAPTLPQSPQAAPEATFTAATPTVASASEAKAPFRPAQAQATKDLAPAIGASPEDLLAEEVRLLQEAKALVRSNPNGALAKTREHAQRFPKGTLSIEREMVTIEALVSAGRMQDARSHASGLRGSVKGTIYASRLESLVGPEVP